MARLGRLRITVALLAVGAVVALTLLTVALALAAAGSSGSTSTALWLAAATGAAAVATLVAAFLVSLPVLVTAGQRARRVSRRSIAIDQSLIRIERSLRDLERSVAPISHFEQRASALVDEHQVTQRRLRQLADDVASLLERVEACPSEATLVQELSAARDQVVRSQEQTGTFTFGQVEGLAALYADLQPNQALPSMSGFALSPDLGALLVDRILRDRPEVVVETGSGVSTVLFALAVAKVGRGRVFAIEHDSGYAQATRDLLTRFGVSEFAEVLVCPLRSVEIDGERFDWYDISAVVFESVDLLLVDGPPASVGRWSRYPAVPLLIDRLREGAIIVLDDARRPQEQEVVDRWCRDFPLRLSSRPRHVRGTAVLQLDRDSAETPEPSGSRHPPTTD